MSIGISSLLDKHFEAAACHVRDKVNFLGVLTDCLFSALRPAGVLSCVELLLLRTRGLERRCPLLCNSI